MSVPTFHSHFKAVTGTSPMQYLEINAPASGPAADAARQPDRLRRRRAVGYEAFLSSAASLSGFWPDAGAGS